MNIIIGIGLFVAGAVSGVIVMALMMAQKSDKGDMVNAGN